MIVFPVLGDEGLNPNEGIKLLTGRPYVLTKSEVLREKQVKLGLEICFVEG